MLYQDIDWNKLWQEGRKKKSWKNKKGKDWDARAKGFAERNVGSPYVDRFINLIHPDPNWTVLDIGCGPGTLAIPLAKIVKKVTAVDFSTDMLKELQQRAEKEKLNNINTIHGSWEDNWQKIGIKPHDVAIASRSLAVNDLKTALKKLNDHTNKTVFISDRVGPGPFDPDIFEAIGREFKPGPDYIYTVNLLYQMDIHARVDFITIDAAKTYPSPQKALESCAWIFDTLTAQEEKKLEVYVENHLVKINDTKWQLKRRLPPQWALIWWHKRN